MGLLHFGQTAGLPRHDHDRTPPGRASTAEGPQHIGPKSHPNRRDAAVPPRATCLDSDMESEPPERIVSATRVISASAERIFELIADPSRQPSWDGNNNLASSAPGQRVRQVGDVFKTTLTTGAVRENHVVEFIEGSKIAWCPAEPRKQPPGHLWRWELNSINATLTSVTHTYDWTALTDNTRLARARSTTADMLRLSMDRLAVLAQASDGG
jgi:uncharacterized protein YndB with AHSA1/START domain